MAATITPVGEVMVSFQTANGSRIKVVMDRKAALLHVEQVVDCLERLRATSEKDAEIDAFIRALRV